MNRRETNQPLVYIHLFGYLIFLTWLIFTITTPRIVYAQSDDQKSPINASPSNDLLSATDLLPVIEDALLNAGAPAGIKVTLSNPDATFPFEAGSLSRDDFSYVSFSKASGRFVMRASHNAIARPITITGFASTPVHLPVLKDDIERGGLIESANIEWLDSTNSNSSNTILEMEDLIGKIARRALRAGTPVRKSDIRKPVLVTRGALVTTYYKKGGLTLSNRAIAEETGSHGDVISVHIPRSDRTLKAVISGQNQVSVISSPDIAATTHAAL